MRRTGAVLLGALVACGGCAPEPAAVSFRDPSAIIASTTRGAPASLDGDWIIVASYPGSGPSSGPGTGPAAGQGLSFRLDASGAGTMTGPGGTQVLAADGLARWRLGDQRLWLLWADADFRIAVIGAPDGRLGWIMERPQAQGRSDLRAAAREVMEFNGYDLAQLVGAR